MGSRVAAALKYGLAGACVVLLALLIVFAPRLDPDHDAPTDLTPTARVLLVLDVVADAFEQVRDLAPHSHHHRTPLTASIRLVVFATACLSALLVPWARASSPAWVGTNPLPVTPPPRS